MPVKEYGIYVAYPPTVDLRVEGLGRYLAAFLKGAEGRNDVHFTIVCPSWSHDSLQQLFLGEDVPRDKFRVIGPKGKPYALHAYEAWKAYQKRERGSGWLRRLTRGLDQVATRAQNRLERRGISVNSASTLLMFCLEALPVGALLLALAPLWIPMLLIDRWKPLIARVFQKLAPRIAVKKARLKALLDEPQGVGFVQRLFADMEQSEALRMQKVIEHLHEVKAWYCPTAFWPAFNEIKAPRLMCVPDVVLADFPVGFSSINGNYTLQVFEKVQESIHSAHTLVTYSDAVKWGTLVDRYGIHPDKVSVIHHAANKLNRWVDITGFPDTERTARHHCQKLLFQALERATNIDYTAGLANRELKFIFYASQFRPNKNIITLLRAYEYLLRNRYVSHKLILTGNPRTLPEIREFLVAKRLENDVLCLPKLSIAELAACYKLATLAVNPSLSEGGCPFTFTEALSVHTPVIMARIPVTEEVLTDPDLQEVSFFDPYDWQDCAQRIEWGLAHTEELLALQRITYAELSKRSWSHVVNEHIEVLDRISSGDRIPHLQ